jgi:hypothetical protein
MMTCSIPNHSFIGALPVGVVSGEETNHGEQREQG